VSDLKKQTLKGIAFLGIGKSAGKVISFVNTLILARILAPEDYGLMAMAMVIAGFVSFFNDVGFGSAIIQRKTVTDAQLSGVFYISMLISVVLFILTVYFAPYAADFYGNSQVTPILQVLALTFLMGGVRAVPQALLTKEMRFKLLSGVEFAGILIQCIVTLVLALLGYEVWSLVWGAIIASFIKTSLVAWGGKWLPSLNGKILDAMELMKFGLTVTYSRVTWYMYTNAQTLILGKVVGDKQTGVFSMAQTLANLPTEHITSLVIKVASPLFAKLQDDLNGLTFALLKLTAGLSLITFPVLAGMMLTAEQLVPILLGDQWLAAIIPMQFLCVMGFFKAIDPLLTQAFISLGKANITARYTSICAVVIPVAVLIGSYYYGINGAAIALAVVYPALMLLLLIISRSVYNLSILGYFKQLITPITGCLFMAVSVFAVNMVASSIELQSYILFTSKVIAGVVSYAFWIIYVRKDGIFLLRSVLLDIGVPEHKLAMWPFKPVKKTQEGLTGEK